MIVETNKPSFTRPNGEPMSEDKLILDACCGARMMWFDKAQPQTLFIDIREDDAGFIKQRPHREVKPDLVLDFRALPFRDKTFKHIVWDPPHMKTLGETSIMRKTYGCLNADTWRWDLGKGFSELWRCLDDYGTLVFKWNETEIKLHEVLKCFSEAPLYGHPIGSEKKTHWMVFVKIPKVAR